MIIFYIQTWWLSQLECVSNSSRHSLESKVWIPPGTHKYDHHTCVSRVGFLHHTMMEKLWLKSNYILLVFIRYILSLSTAGYIMARDEPLNELNEEASPPNREAQRWSWRCRIGWSNKKIKKYLFFCFAQMYTGRDIHKK